VPIPTRNLSGFNVAGTRPKQPQDLLLSVLIALLILAALLTLFIFRSYDDNRLTSWSWVFADFSPVKFLIILVVGMLIAYPLSRFSMPERTSIFLLSTAAFLVAAFFWRQPEVIVDASRYFVQAKQVELHGPGYFLKEWGNAIPAWTDLPLIPFIYGVVFRVFGENRISIQIFNTLLFSGTVVLTYLIGKSLWNKNIGLYAGVLLLGMPYLIIQVPLMMVDVAAMFFLTLAVFATIKTVESGKTGLCISASVAITLAMLTKYSNWLMLSVIPFIFLGYFQQGWKVLVRQGVIVAVGVLVLIGIFLLAKFDVVIEQLRLLQTFQMPALGAWEESLVSTFFFQVHPVITVTAVFSLYRALREKEIKYLIVSWMLILVLLLDIKRIRYLIVIFPMMTLMSAYGLEVLKGAGIRKFIVSCTAISAVLIATSAYLPFLEKTSAINIKQAGEYLDSIAVDKVGVHVLLQPQTSINPSVAVPILDLFTDRELVYHEDRNSTSVPGGVNRLPLRWTWELSSPQYLKMNSKGSKEHGAIVVIQGGADQPPPEHIARIISNYHVQKEFNVSDRAFKYQTIVRIFQRNVRNTGEEPN
jgi:hypothetical protein